jgi:hypothetical protein
MNDRAPTVEDDLAYLRSVVDSDRGAHVRYKFGVVYLVSGLVWGPYGLIIWAANMGWFTLGKQLNGLLWLIVMVLFFGAMAWSAWGGRRAPRDTVPTRAFSAAFAGIGMSYLVMLTVLMWAAHKLNNGVFVIVYCVVVFAGQGAGWYVFWVLRREPWIALVAIGWYGAAVLTGFNMRMPDFLLYMGLSMLLLMALPGWLMIRRNPVAAAA